MSTHKNKKSVFFYILIFIALVIYFTTREEKQSSPSSSTEFEELMEEVEDEAMKPEILGEPSMNRNFYIIFDGSGSMASYLDGEIKIVGAKKAIVKFLAQIPQDVNMGLYLFDDYGRREVVPLQPIDKERLLEAINESLLKKGVHRKDLPKKVEEYEKALKKHLGPHNGKLLREFTMLYDALHIAGYYRGLIYNIDMVKDALKATKSFIDKIK